VTALTSSDIAGTIQQAPARLSKPTGVQLFPLEKENALHAEAPVLDFEQPDPEPSPMQRLGETFEFRCLLFRLLELNGWTIDERPAVGGVIFIARRDGHVVQCYGATAADVATDLFQAAATVQGRSVAG
jgi:hypothetical protein